MRTQPPDISRSFTIAVFIHQNRFLYILHSRLNHFSGSSSHSPQPPGVNVSSTIRKEPARSLQRLVALTSSQSSRRPQSECVCVHQHICRCVFLRIYAPWVYVCAHSNFCLLFGYMRPSYMRYSYMSSQHSHRAMCCLISSPARHTLTTHQKLMLNFNSISSSATA